MGVARHTVIALIDQGLLSAANFGLGLFLIAVVSKEQYGAYVIAYTAVLLLVGYQNAIITTQMTVLAPHKPVEQQRQFCAALGVGSFFIFFPLAALSFGITMVAYKFLLLEKFTVLALLAISMILVPVLSREFMRSYFFLTLRPRVVLCLDAAYVGLLIIGISVFYFVHPEQLVVGALTSIGIASVLAWIISMRMAGLPVGQSLPNIKNALAEAWSQGKWALGGVTVTSIQSQSYVYLLALFGGGSLVGEAAAARLFLMPISLLSVAVARILTPRWAIALSTTGLEGVTRSAMKILWFLVLIMLVYIIFVVMNAETIIGIFVTDEYRHIKPLLLLWGLVFLFQIVRSNMSIQLQVMHCFRAITLANCISAVVVVILSVYLISLYGSEGAICSMIIGEIILAILLFHEVRKEIKRQNKNMTIV